MSNENQAVQQVQSGAARHPQFDEVEHRDTFMGRMTETPQRFIATAAGTVALIGTVLLVFTRFILFVESLVPAPVAKVLDAVFTPVHEINMFPVIVIMFGAVMFAVAAIPVLFEMNRDSR